MEGNNSTQMMDEDIKRIETLACRTSSFPDRTAPLHLIIDWRYRHPEVLAAGKETEMAKRRSIVESAKGLGHEMDGLRLDNSGFARNAVNL